MKKGKTLLTALVTASLIVFGGAALAGCGGPSDEEVVRQGVTEELDALKAHDPALMEELSSDVDAADLSVYGIEPEEFLTAYLDGFDYRIEGVDVDGKTATAHVVLTCKSFTAYAEALTEASNAMATDETLADLSEEELNQKIGQTVMDALANVQPAETETIDLAYTLEGNVWTPTPEAEAAISNALFSN